MLASRQAEQENANKKGDRAGYGNGGCERKPCHNSPLRKMIPRLKARFKLLLLSGFQALLVRQSRWNCDAGRNFVYLILAGLYSSTMPKPLRAPPLKKGGGFCAVTSIVCRFSKGGWNIGRLFLRHFSSQTVISATLCWNLRRVSRIAKGISRGSPSILKYGERCLVNPSRVQTFSPASR
jgi:hypothetical protein